MADATRSLTDFFGMFGTRRVADAGPAPDTSVTNAAEASYPTKALHKYCEPWVRFREPSGGFYFWLELLDTVDWDRARELAAARGVACRPGDTFVGDDSGRRFLRLSPIQVPDADIEPGIVALAEALRVATR